MGHEGAWRDLAHGSSSTGYAKEEGRSHLEDQLDRLLDQPVEFLNSTGQASTRSSWKSKFDVGATAFILQSSVTSSSSITALDLVQFDHLMFDSVNATTCTLSLQLRHSRKHLKLTQMYKM
ncbi:unnamed protein product [Microthlaspi erraticum]|uniref:Uncharacterized protein n=1 Tax=Microthlaspi erraticum TaxID=1685480 RepID=A0A6D2L0N3_9BRAS|nr:unnamed protein product [Microthlaspi erraticum]